VKTDEFIMYAVMGSLRTMCDDGDGQRVLLATFPTRQQAKHWSVANAGKEDKLKIRRAKVRLFSK